MFSGGSDGYTYNSQQLHTSLLGSTPSSVITDDCILEQRFIDIFQYSAVLSVKLNSSAFFLCQVSTTPTRQ